MQFDINQIERTANQATQKTLAEIREIGFDHNFGIGYKEDIAFKVFVQPNQTNFALCSDTLREWLDKFFHRVEEELTPLEAEYFTSITKFADEHPIFRTTEDLHTNMWLEDTHTEHTPNGVAFAYTSFPFDLEKPDYELLERVLKAGYAVLALTTAWLEEKRIMTIDATNLNKQ